jgi:hypothetical protein
VADVVILDNDLSGACSDVVVRERMKTCSTLPPSGSSRACIVFLHTDTLRATADGVLNVLVAKQDLKIVLISSSNNDNCVPWWTVRPDGNVSEVPVLRELLIHPRIIKWFAENPCIEHPKLRALPLGPKFRTSQTFFGEDVFEKRAAYVNLALRAASQNSTIRKVGIMTRMDVHTNDDPMYQPHKRIRSSFLPLILRVKHEIDKSSGNNSMSNIDFSLYAKELLSTSHVWSPPGRGIDSHRTWEALLGGAIPIVLDSPMRSAYHGLNVLSLRDFGELNIDTVTESAAKLAVTPVNIFSPVFCFYWIQEIEKVALLL